MPRGRPPATTDAAAVAALAEVREFMRKNRLKDAQLARVAHVAPATVTRVLARDPPTWTDGFKTLVDYIKSTNSENLEVAKLAQSLREGKETAHATATLLRAVANLLEKA